MDNNKCKAHSGLVTQIEKVEEEVKVLWKKWDKGIMLLFVILGGVIVNLFVLLAQQLIGK